MMMKNKEARRRRRRSNSMGTIQRVNLVSSPSTQNGESSRLSLSLSIFFFFSFRRRRRRRLHCRRRQYHRCYRRRRHILLNMDPGPSNPVQLYLQNTHRSQTIWDNASTVVLCCRRREAVSQHTIPFDERIVPYLQQAGFIGVAQIGFIQLDWHLITALVERWRPETHTFHMPGGECTITLQDIAVQFGLPVDGEPVTGSLQHDWKQICEDFLGVRPLDLKGSRLSLPWLASQFTELSPDADDVSIQRYARAYIMQLIGGFLFADKSNTLVHLMFLPLLASFEQAGNYSWGGACLAWLYRELCRASHAQALDIAGPLILLQVWAYDRFSIVAPQVQLQPPEHFIGRPLSARWSGVLAASEQSANILLVYRSIFDRLMKNQINWTPYTPHVMSLLPDYCHDGQDIWLTVSPLICFHIVEWHQPDRVLRQFGMRQTVPTLCNTLPQLHQIDLRGKHDQNWRQIHAEYISFWRARHGRCAQGEIINESDVSNDYLSWYDSITRRFITPDGAYYYCMNNFVHDVHNYSLEHNLPELSSMCEQNMVNVEEIIQHTRRLNVADTDRKRIRRRRQRQRDEGVPEQPDDQEPPILQPDIASGSGHQQEYYGHHEFPSVVTQQDIDDVIHQQQQIEVPVPRRGQRARRRPPCGT